MASKTNEGNAGPSLDDSVKKTIEILSKIIKKPPLTAKLLSKPPFRYLHDMFSEIIKTTSFVNGLYDDSEMNSENVKEKEAKVAYLLKMVDCVGMVTGVEIKVNPLKIVAGLDPEETNAFLQMLGKAVMKKVDTTDIVKRTKQPSTSSAAAAAPSASASAPKPSQPQAAAKTTLNRSAAAPVHDGKATAPKIPSGQASTGQSSDSGNKSVAHTKDNASAIEKKSAPPPQASAPPPKIPEKHVEPLSENFPSDDQLTVNKQSDFQERDAEDTSADEDRTTVKSSIGPAVIKRRERPSSARPPPPKVRASEVAVVEELPVLAPGIIQENSKPDDDDDNESFLIVQNDKTGDAEVGQAGGQSQDENHGGLVRKILETKVKLEGKLGEDKSQDRPVKDKNTARREIEALRESIQSLCRNANPLAKTLDYLQEDVDSMNKELESWKAENKKHKLLFESELRDTKEVMAPLEARLKQVETGIEDLLDKISNAKATIIQNDSSLQRLLRNITHPVK
ncbi:microtubule-binding protein MIP-T3-domain-containing protein [Chytridium lagenaria]|nr:microtubule-binding protein MIP-T3-domain-containing protein [Chytridium lagenaria]